MSEEKPYKVFAYQIQMQADGLAARLGGPVYLCGSALTEARPHDYDVRAILPAAEMVRLFGPDDSAEPRPLDALTTPRRWRVLRENLKQSRRLSRALRRNVDFQIQSEEDALRYENKARVRLDRAPEGFFEAGKGEA